jgi:hypothetical protein
LPIAYRIRQSLVFGLRKASPCGLFQSFHDFLKRAPIGRGHPIPYVFEGCEGPFNWIPEYDDDSGIGNMASDVNRRPLAHEVKRRRI